MSKEGQEDQEDEEEERREDAPSGAGCLRTMLLLVLQPDA